MKTSKQRAVNSSFYTISYDMHGLGKTITSPGHIQLVYTISSDVIGLDKTKMTRLREDWDFLLLAFRGKEENNKIDKKFQERKHSPNYFCITVSQI